MQDTRLFGPPASSKAFAKPSRGEWLPRRTHDLKSYLFVQCFGIHFRRAWWKDALVLKGPSDGFLPECKGMLKVRFR